MNSSQIFEQGTVVLLKEEIQKQSSLIDCQIISNQLENFNFSAISMENVEIIKSLLNKNILDGITGRGLVINQSNLNYSSFNLVRITESNIFQSQMIQTQFNESYLELFNMEESFAPSIKFKKARLMKCQFINTDMMRADFSGSIIMKSVFKENRSTNILNLQKSIWMKAIVIDSDFNFLDLSYSNLKDAIFIKCRFSNTSFFSSELLNSSFIECDFKNCDFTDAAVL